MNIDLHPIIDNRKRLIVPVSEFSFAAYPVQIKQGFRCLAHAPRSQNTPNKPQWRGWIQQVLNWLRGACGTVVVVPVSI
jgi:hypothetical protein